MLSLLTINWNPNPELFNLFGHIPVRYYGLLWVIGIACSYFVVRYQYRDKKIGDDKFEPLFFYCFFGILIGARLGHCLFYQPEYYLHHFWEMILPIQFLPDGGWKWTGYAGLASHGGTLGLMIALWLYCRKMKMHYMDVLDMIAVATPICACFIRLANLMNSEIIGKATDVPWAFVFERVDMLPRHPAQLYEAIAYFIFFLLMIFGVKRPLGQLFLELFGVKIVFSWAATVIAAVAISFPLMYRAARGAFEQVDVTLIYAARTLGFSESRIFWKVILPSAMPGVLSGAILAFARGLGEFGATAMLAGNIAGKTQTLPLAIYSQVAAGKMSMAYQYVWIIVVISFLVVVLMNVLSRRDMRGRSNHKKKDNSVEAGGQDAKVSVELFADREADAQKGGAR